MKLICLDVDNCGYSTLSITNNLEYNIDINQSIQMCPECKDSLAMLVDDLFYFDTLHPAERKRIQILEFLKSLEEKIKL